MAGVEDRPRRRRRDAERNREALLAAAVEVFTEHGTSAAVDLVARRAGVGPATLYRHFATKDELVEAVLSELASRLAERIRGAAALEDPEAAFRAVLHGIAEHQVADRSFRDLLSWHDVTVAELHPALAEMGALLIEAVDRAKAAAVLRPDVEVGDVMLLLVAVDGIAGSTGAVSRDALHRIVDVLADGLCTHRTDLTGEPLDVAGLWHVARAR